MRLQADVKIRTKFKKWRINLFFLALSQYFQVGLVSGGISTQCGDKNIPSYFTRLDHPEIASFIANPSDKGNNTLI